MKISHRIKSEGYQIPEFLEKEHFPSLDGLRGIAVLFVISSHFGLNYFLRYIHFRFDGRFGVDIFFVLSGFLITTGLMKQKLKTGRFDLFHFYIKRALRILPLVYLFLIILFLVGIFWKPIASETDYLYSFLFLKNLPVSSHPSTAHFWTLACEWQFYLVFPALLFWLREDWYFTLSLFIIILPALLCILDYYVDLKVLSPPLYFLMKLVKYTFYRGPIILLFGSVTSLLCFKVSIGPVFFRRRYFFSFFLFIAALLLYIKDLPFYHLLVSQYISSILIALVILASFNSENFFSKILCSKVLVKTGILSYSIYIWQQLFIGGYFWFPGLERLNTLPFAVIMMVKFIIIIPLAYLSYHLCEKQFLKLKHKFR